MTALFLPVLVSAQFSDSKRHQVDSDVTELLKQLRGKLKDIHTATYDLTQSKYFTPTDSFPYSVEHFSYIECENPSDSCGNAKYVKLKVNPVEFSYAYNGDSIFYNNDSLLICNTPMAIYDCPKMVAPPFFNHVTSLVDYLLIPNERVAISLEDHSEYWIINADVREFGLLCFFGKPYQMVSEPYAPEVFRLRIPKSTLLPDQLSYGMGWPQQKCMSECYNVTLNPYPAETFSISDYLPDTALTDIDTANRKTVPSLKDNLKNITNLPAPTDTLISCEGEEFSLAQCKGRPVLLELTSTTCGPCIGSYPVLNKLMKEYAGKDLEVIGVLCEHSADYRAVKSYQKMRGIEFPLMRDNNRFHGYFSCGVTPVFVAIDRDGIVRACSYGFNKMKPEKEETKLRELIESVM